MPVKHNFKNINIPEEAKSLAAKYMREGWGSRSSVIHAIYDLFETDLPIDVFLKFCRLIDPLHGPASAIYRNGKGIGLTVCGALTSALLAFSMVHNQTELPFKFWTEGLEPKGWINEIIDDPRISCMERAYIFSNHCLNLGYGAYYQIIARFYTHFGTTDCLELQKPYGDAVSRECFRNCARVVIWTAGMVAEVILEYEKNPAAFTKLEDDNVYIAVARANSQ